MLKKDYKYNFSHFMGQCELNYMLMCRLLHDRDSEDEFDYLIKERYKINLTIKERCKYTTCVRFSLQSSKQPDWLPVTAVDVRLYHDAHLAEVVEQSGMAMQPKNPYPNPNMLQTDEKMGVNEFLGEWLSFCLSHGESSEMILIDRLSSE